MYPITITKHYRLAPFKAILIIVVNPYLPSD
jgi:hypothetical protein